MITEELKIIAEKQILEEKEPVSFDTREYPVEVLIDKYKSGEFIVPNYQREFVWKRDKVKMSKFIESIILDLPIPYLFFADEPETGKLEIVDGSQRIRTLVAFYDDEFELEGLDILDHMNGFKYSDIIESRKRRIQRKTLRSIELTEKASSDVKRDLFSRINTKPYDLLPMEIRKGLYQGEFYTFIENCANGELFSKLCPISEERRSRGEGLELVLRYFAYTEKYGDFVHSVEDFLDDYMKDKHDNGFDKTGLEKQFNSMLDYVDEYFPRGFKKVDNSKSVSRVRFDSISVGVTLALKLKNKDTLNNDGIQNWIDSNEYNSYVTSGSANNKTKLMGRIEYVRNKLLGE